QRSQSNTPTLTRDVGYLLAGLARCASCSFAMRPSRQTGRSVAIYRCTTVTAHGRCPGPSTISATRLERHVIDVFLERAGAAAFAPVDTSDDEVEAAAAAIAMAERSYRSALTDLELRLTIGDADHAELVARLHAEWQDALAAAPPPPTRT